MPSTIKPNKRIVSIQVCRGLAAMAVVLAHLDNVERKYFPTHIMAPFQYGVAGVDVFFVISGIVISMVTLGKFRQAKQAVRFLYHRIARVYPIFWVYSVLILAAYLYNPHWVNANSGGHVELVRSFLLFPSHYQFLLMQGWTLTYEVYFYLVFFVLLLVCPERWAPWALIGWAIGSYVGLSHVPYSPLIFIMRSPLLFQFLAGCLLLHFYRRSRLHPAAGGVLLALSVMWMAGIALWGHRAFASPLWYEEQLDWRALLFGVFAVLFVAGAMELERSELIRFSRPLVALGDWSYSIYLSHIIVLELFARALHAFVPRMPMGILVIDAVSIPAVLLVGYLSYTFIERPLMALLYNKPQRKPAPVLAA